MILSNKHRFSVQHTQQKNTVVPDSVIYDRMRLQLANHIAAERTSVHKGEFSTTYQMDVYVLDADDLAKLIHEEAMRYIGVRP